MVFNFGGEIYSLFEGESYTIPTITNETALNNQFDIELGFTVSRAIVQLTVDQYGEGSVPSVVLSNADNSERKRLPISGLDTATTDEIEISRVEIETEITEQIG